MTPFSHLNPILPIVITLLLPLSHDALAMKTSGNSCSSRPGLHFLSATPSFRTAPPITDPTLIVIPRSFPAPSSSSSSTSSSSVSSAPPIVDQATTDKLIHRFFIAIKIKKQEEITKGLDAGVINAVNAEGMTPFLIAIYKGDIDVVRFLLELNEGAYRDNLVHQAETRSGKNGLMIAAWLGHNEIITLLLPYYKGQIDARDGFAGRTALMIAATHANLSAVKLLQKAGADVLAKDNNNKTALMHAIDNVHEAVGKPHPDAPVTLRVLLRAGAKDYLEEKDTHQGATVLMFAAGKNAVWALKILLRFGANIHAVDKFNQSILTFAHSMRAKEAEAYLLKAGARYQHYHYAPNSDPQSSVMGETPMQELAQQLYPIIQSAQRPAPIPPGPPTKEENDDEDDA